nr:hypothetical protein [Actinomadura madurae]
MEAPTVAEKSVRTGAPVPETPAISSGPSMRGLPSSPVGTSTPSSIPVFVWLIRTLVVPGRAGTSPFSTANVPTPGVRLPQLKSQ